MRWADDSSHLRRLTGSVSVPAEELVVKGRLEEWNRANSSLMEGFQRKWNILYEEDIYLKLFEDFICLTYKI